MGIQLHSLNRNWRRGDGGFKFYPRLRSYCKVLVQHLYQQRGAFAEPISTYESLAYTLGLSNQPENPRATPAEAVCPVLVDLKPETLLA